MSHLLQGMDPAVNQSLEEALGLAGWASGKERGTLGTKLCFCLEEGAGPGRPEAL